MTAPRPRPAEPVWVTGLAVRSACGPDVRSLGASALPAFTQVTRFEVTDRRSTVAATAPGSPRLADELVTVLDEACRQAESAPGRDPLLLALHGDQRTAAVSAEVAVRAGWAEPARVYTGACVASSTAVADAAALIAGGRRQRVVVAAGYLVEEETFAVFDAGRALAKDGAVRPFSRGRDGLLLGDAAVAVVLESASAATERGVPALARLAGWGRAGDAYHVCRPVPDGNGQVRAVEAALARAGVGPAEVDYVNANGTGSAISDRAEAAALRRLFGESLATLPVSSTKSLHGHALEASALLELAVVIGALNDQLLPVNAGWLGPDEDCPLDLVLDRPRPADVRYALSLNSAFGGANTALLVGAP